MATGAREVQIGRVDVEEIVTVRFQLLQLIAAALGKDDMALVAVVGGYHLGAVIALVVAVVTAETAG